MTTSSPMAAARSQFRRATTGVAAAVLLGTTVLASGAMAAPTDITLWRHIGDLQPEMDAFAASVESFNAAQDDWRIVWEELPQQSYDQSINAAALAGSLPCVIDVDGPFVPNFAWGGTLVPLDDYLGDDLRADLLPSVIGEYNGKTYGVGQFDASLAIWGRKSVLEKNGIRIPAGLDDPWTREEFDEALRKLKESGEFETAIDLFTFYTHEWLPYGYSPFLQSFGGDLIDRSTYLTAEGALNGPEAVAWGEWWQSLFADGLADPKSTDDQAFLQGRAALAWIGNWYYPNMLEAWGEDLIYLPPPDLGNGPKVGGGSWQWAITSTCAHPEGAWAFIEYLLEPERVAELSDITGLIPGRGASAPMTERYGDGAALEGLVDVSNRFATIRPPTPAYMTIRVEFERAVQTIANGGDVRDALDQAVASIDADIEANDGYGFQ